MLIFIRESAKKDLKKLDKSLIKKIFEKIQALQNFPNTANVKKLKNFTPTHRLRVGDYRVLFDVEDELITIGRIKHKKEAY